MSMQTWNIADIKKQLISRHLQVTSCTQLITSAKRLFFDVAFDWEKFENWEDRPNEKSGWPFDKKEYVEGFKKFNSVESANAYEVFPTAPKYPLFRGFGSPYPWELRGE